MDVVRHKLDIYEESLSGIEARNNEVYRSIFALDPIIDTSAVADNSLNEMVALERRLDLFQGRIDRQMSAMGEVALVAKNAGDMVSCIPAVPPLLPKKGTYHLSSPFGVRTDPVYGGLARHTGQDFASKTGNPVYATGDGVVEKVDFKFNGYGNEVVINHGFGYKSRYAHLSTIDVGVGQALHRGDKIGEVGKSGKATGPHLHYEVLYKNNAVNPMSFMDMSMPVEEYRAMIVKRRMENESSRPSAAAMGQRQRKQGTNGRK
ncbi:MAG: M23 family metallopeptidase [Bacteroidales bacterium]|nr:M23 family metallopeptidase [Bacteroidales bacterium]